VLDALAKVAISFEEVFQSNIIFFLWGIAVPGQYKAGIRKIYLWFKGN